MENNALAVRDASFDVIPAMNADAIDKVRQIETAVAKAPQVKIDTHHIIHGGMYVRTIRIPAGVMITGVLIKVPTILVVKGDAVVYTGSSTKELHGYSILSAEAGRKQAFVALTDVHLSMMFPTQAQTAEAAEREFTDETELLVSRRHNEETVSKEFLCQA